MLISRSFATALIVMQAAFLFLILIGVWKQNYNQPCPNNLPQQEKSIREVPSESVSQNNLIVGVALSLPITVVSHFVQSARLTCRSCTISLFIYKHESESRDFVDLAHIYDIQWLVYEEFDVSAKYSEPSNIIRKIRWLLFNTYFNNLVKQDVSIIDVFITDVAGVTFQTNIFAHTEAYGKGLCIFNENPPVLVGTTSAYRESLIGCFDVNIAEKLANKNSFSPSAIVGSWESIKSYVATISNLIVNHEESPCSTFLYDNHFHFYAIYVTDVSSRTTIYQIPQETSFIALRADESTFVRNGFGLALNSNGTIFAVIHGQNPNKET
ncbi:unnamed protein product [Rotaria socialis]|uniref:Uncharacterized protein n=1 Tax=Rotaria socialis TaxID=392032 RepID=A0A821PR76_9BILA|nr:unnamed protein product [Rotaria socialis]CAF4812544.1 unnamed protein product [Rotaria socialis]